MNFSRSTIHYNRGRYSIAELQSRWLSKQRQNAGRAGFILKLVEVSGHEKTCQWIEGEPRDRNFCGDDAKPGSSYCEHHHSICYKRVLTRDE